VLAALLRACHPEPAAAVTLVSGVLAIGAGLDARTVVAVTAAVGASQLAVGWSNDAIDAPRDAAVGRRDKPIPAGAVSRRVVAVGAVVAAGACAVLAFVAGPGWWLLAALASALLYNWPLKFTPASVVPFAVSFGLLPGFVMEAGPGVPAWMLAAGALLGAGAHFANVVPDLADDARTGVRGLPHRLGARGSLVAAAVLLLAATAVLVVGPPGPPSWFGFAAGAVAVAVLPLVGYWVMRAPGSRLPFRAVLVIAVLDVALLVVGGT